MKKINICQPGFGASCALCCGSHNYLKDKDSLNELFKNRQNLFSKEIKNSQIFKKTENSLKELNFAKLHDDAIQCHLVGFINEKNIGCMAYNYQNYFDENLNSFFTNTCNKFFCFAWEKLSNDEIIFAAKLLGDWYYYTLLINSIQMLKKLYKKYKTPENISKEKLLEIKNELENLLKSED